ncbi:DUF262 domain-containing protein [Acinetobacter sp. Z1]|uniref:DUF262 domain-containing protein n=1 Tax=Acinetobacter sp. Z1 TaxID=2953738 RepID=UPI0020C86DC8|nr:DUF262 domain-containing protein [Acinetobacter sp. Z1]UTO19442.1 DUF262 domain-containing protein [Acinetobacter sp. Z1]
MENVLASIPSTNVKIIELYNKITSNSLDTSPTDFQRKLVWKKQHKYYFIETILANYPFPEVYIASKEIDVSNITATEVVVDGQQRLTTIVDYIKGEGDFVDQNKIPSFDSLDLEKKKNFLNYLVSVRDLKNIKEDVMKEIFQRINNTEYSLNAIEKINAQYGDSEFIVFCKQLIDSDFVVSPKFTDIIFDSGNREKFMIFIQDNEIFSENDRKRMADLQFMMTLVATLIEGSYFSRNTKTQKYIEEYNNEFISFKDMERLMMKTLDCIMGLSLTKGSYWYNKSNFFTLFVEISKCVQTSQLKITEISNNLNNIEEKSRNYFRREIEGLTNDEITYFEYAKEAVNEKNVREFRGDFLRKILDYN